MAFIDRILLEPSYGWMKPDGQLIKPSAKRILKEFFSRLNIFRNKKNWLALVSWGSAMILIPFIVIFISSYFSWTLALCGFVYGMVVMGSHGTIWYHRYSTHKSYVFKNKFWRFFTRYFVPEVIPDEIYVISHHVHHAKSDTPGDPYNANGGWLYCFLADVNHQLIARDLSEPDYARVKNMLAHTGVVTNSYKQYQKWGSVSNPFATVCSVLFSAAFWFGVFYLIGGPALACALMSGACLWAIGVRTFNYDGHGRGQDKRVPGKDFNFKDQSVNQYWPGFVAGEWHNNHHLYPSSARAGFLRYQLDLAWYYIYVMYKLGAVVSYHNATDHFMKNHFFTRSKVIIPAPNQVVTEMKVEESVY